MNSSPLVGIVTVTYNSGAVIRDFMDCALKQRQAEFILYVIDNASSDNTLKVVSEYSDPRVVVVRNPVNEGVAEGNNIGIRAALKDGCASVLLVNNDTVFEPDLVNKLMEGMRRHACDMVVPKILFFDEPQRIWCAGGYFSTWRGSARHFGTGKKDDGRCDQPRAVHYSPTCCMLIAREVFGRVGLMDANYFVYFDDTDFSMRASRAGVRLFYIPTARLLHKVSSLTGGESDFTYRYSTRNHIYYLLKNFPRWYGVYYFPALQIHIFAKYLLLRRRPKSFWVAQKAFWEGVSLFLSATARPVRTYEPTETGEMSFDPVIKDRSSGSLDL